MVVLMRTFLLCISLWVSASAHAVSIWQVSKGQQHLYIGGTVHVLPVSALPLPAAFDTVYQAADELVFETDIRFIESVAFQQMVAQAMMYTDGRTFKDALTPATVSAVETYLSERGLTVDMFLPMKPALLGLSITFLELQRLGMTDDGVDKIFHQQALADNKTISWLETPQQQIEIMRDMAAGNEDAFVMYSLDETDEAEAFLSAMIAAWRVGDIAQLDTIALASMRRDYPGLYDVMLKARNRNWIGQIERMLDDEDIEMVLVGGLHLAGPDSVLTMLAKQGYRITQLQ